MSGTCDCNAARRGAPKLRAIAEGARQRSDVAEVVLRSGFFKSCAAVVEISRESCSSDTARETVMAPMSAQKAHDDTRSCGAPVLATRITNQVCEPLNVS